METKVVKDIFAFKWGQNAPVAFHARNLEVAEISEELWQGLNSDTMSSDLREVLDGWNAEESTNTKSQSSSLKIHSLTLNVTQICNLKCTYCAAGGDGTYGAPQTKISVERTLPQLKFFLERLQTSDTFQIKFLGGEPLLYPEGIRAIGQYVQAVAKERGIVPKFAIVTNGTLLNESNIQLLKDLQCHITVSIDGPAETNNAARPFKNGQGSTDVVVEGIKKLCENKDQLGSIVLHGVFQEGNMNLIKAYDFYKSFAVDKYEFTYGVTGESEETSNLFAEQMATIAATAFAESGELGLRKISFFDNVFCNLDEQIRLENHCCAGKSFLVVDAKNNLFTCPWDVGQASEAVGRDSTLNMDRLEEYSKSLIDRNQCNTCWARHLCGGGCMFIHKQSSGSKNIKSNIFCSRMRLLLTTTLLFYKKCREVSTGGEI